MKKYVVETYYTCTFKTVHTLNNLDDSELAKIDNRTDGDVEVLDVKLNNRKTKKLGGKKEDKVNKSKPVESYTAPAASLHHHSSSKDYSSPIIDTL